ncbi:MAG: hypothetical protein CMD06_07435 [Flavobacteriales bacterium]|nr:hypothetical protein [Flavobacteriales bacterium]
MKNIFKILQILVCFSLLIVSIIYVNEKHNLQYCTLENINLIDVQDTFLDEELIKRIIVKDDYLIDSTSLYNFNSSRLEDQLRKNPFVLDVEVFYNQLGSVNIQVKAREPVVRIMTEDKNYYLDVNGVEMPISTHHAPRVLVVTGNVKKSNHNSIINFIKNIGLISFWNSQITQLHCVDNEFILIPLVGNHKIHFGELNDINQKLNMLYNFYKYEIALASWNIYSDISLKYKNQIVCIRNN